jgi:hypothetical protein
MPYNVIIDPVFATPWVRRWSAIAVEATPPFGQDITWLQAFRYKVTNSPEAISNLRQALAGIRSLVDVTGRIFGPVYTTDSPHAQSIIAEEAGHGIFLARSAE